uniref:Transcription initiation factor IIF subunit alpha n=1 Tax=Salix viminalis TaxID=40686 RepID=A0A6N2K1R0_SALVM
MSFDLLLKPSCSGCGSTTDLYGSNCKHMTLCLSCGKTMAENRGKCFDCGATVTRLIREYNVRASTSSDKNYFIGRFVSGLPSFSKKKNAENKWSLHKEGIIGRQITDALREKLKNKPWLLEDETGQSQYQGHLEGSQSATYYLLMMTGKEFVAIPAGSWYNFNKVAHYKQLHWRKTEEKMKNRRKTADGYERWMMKAANNGAAAFGEVEKVDDKEGVSAGGRGGRRKASGDDDEGNVSDRGEEDEEEESGRKSRLGLNKQGGDDDEEGLRGGDLDMDDDDIEKGDDWEHEEIFTDDDEAVAIDPEEREDLAPEAPAPPEIKQMDGDISPVLAPKQKDAELKEEPADNSPAKPTPSSSAKGTPPTSKSTKGKRKLNGEDAKSSNGAPVKKVKTENEVKPTVKEESSPATKGTATPKVTTPSSKTGSTSGSTGPVSEEEIRAVLLQNGPVTTQDLVARFKSRLRTPEDKKAFADILRRISKIQKTSGSNYVVLRDK